jgi:adenylate kinase family enzyme
MTELNLILLGPPGAGKGTLRRPVEATRQTEPVVVGDQWPGLLAVHGEGRG